VRRRTPGDLPDGVEDAHEHSRVGRTQPLQRSHVRNPGALELNRTAHSQTIRCSGGDDDTDI
jgi:hypothetical protein